MSEKKERFDVYRAVTDHIVAAIEKGAGAFVMPWHGAGGSVARPENAYTKMPYHGVNILALWAQAYVNGYADGYWASYKQWQLAGAQVRRGEQGSTVVFYKQLDRNDDSADDGASRKRLIARASRVFNVAQVEEWSPPELPIPLDPIEVKASVSAFVDRTGAEVRHGSSGAWYDIELDHISLPHPGRFIDTPTSTASDAYQATLLHELVHWTGAAHRLDRQLANLSFADRAREELVAEIGAAFLCADLGVANEPRPDHAAYVSHWLQALKNDARALFRAARLASDASNYLHDITSREDE